MSKPYDKLKTAPRFIPGKFACIADRLLVHVLSVEEGQVEVSIGASPAQQFSVQEDTAQVLSDFFGEIAASLRAK